MKKHMKALLAITFALTLCTTSITGCGDTSKNEAQETSIPTNSQAIETSEKSTESSKPLNEVIVNTRYVPEGAKVSNTLPLNTVTFGDEKTGAELFTIDISDCTLADLCEISEEKTNGKSLIKVEGEGIVESDNPELYLCTQAFNLDGGSFDVETMIDGEVVTDRSSYEPSDSVHANPNTSYSDMKIKSISISRVSTRKEAISFCGGAIGFNTPRSEVETALGEGKEFILCKGEAYEKTLYVYQNETATLMIKYAKGEKTANADCVEEIYLFSNK